MGDYHELSGWALSAIMDILPRRRFDMAGEEVM